MSTGTTPGRAAADLGLPQRAPVSWDALLDAAVRRYWERRTQVRAASEA